jgi:hypothetical protein
MNFTQLIANNSANIVQKTSDFYGEPLTILKYKRKVFFDNLWNDDLIEYVDIGYKARDQIERTFKTCFDNYIRVEKSSINLLKGRNHFTAPSVLMIDNKPIPVNLEFKRLKEKSAY